MRSLRERAWCRSLTGVRLAVAVLSTAVAAAAPASPEASPAHLMDAPASAAVHPLPARTPPDFRVLPYLQPAGDGAWLLTWFSGTDAPAEVTLSGPGLEPPRVLRSRGEWRPEMAYTAQEQAQRIEGLTDGSWLWPGRAYRHRVRLDGLQPDRLYTYTVTQGAQRFERAFRTAPSARHWQRLRVVALSDSETEPRGRVSHREWAPGAGAEGRPPAEAPEPSAWARRFGTTVLEGTTVLRYPLTETVGFTENLKAIDAQSPDLVLMPGDLVQGSGYQPAWDEFFRHTAGPSGDLFTRVPLIAAMGNWETFAAASGGYGSPDDRSPVVRARQRFKTFIDGPDNGTPAHRGNYHRVDHGPLTILTLDSTKGAPDDHPSRYPADQRLSGRAFAGAGHDTQASFTAEGYAKAARRLGLPNDLSPFNEGGVQWQWVERQLADARAQGQIILVQFHHAPFSDGEHGLPMNHAQSAGQGGTPMRVYHRLFEKFGVVAVLSGHSELFERSFVDTDGDGVGVHYFDVGVAGDGLRGERRRSPGFVEGPGHNRLQYNPHSCWTADEHEPEQWVAQAAGPHLLGGGKHYGHLVITLTRAQGQEPGPVAAWVEMTPMHVFPVLDEQLALRRTETRAYGDRVRLALDAQGRVLAPPLSPAPKCRRP